MKQLIFFISLSFSSVFASGSGFGLANNTLGNTSNPYSASGAGRSYEISHSDSIQVNFKNFATLTDISTTTITVNTNYSAIFAENRLGNRYNNDAGFEGAYIGIPLIKNTLSMSFGLQPFSSINQKNSKLVDDNIEKRVYLNGGISKASMHFAYKFNSNLSLALGYEYTFGRIDKIVQIPEEGVTDEAERSIKANGVILSGIFEVNPNLKLGMVLKPSAKGTTTIAGQTISEALNATVESDLSLPTELSFGVEYKLSESYYTGFDVIYQDWKAGYEINDKKVKFHDTYYYLGVGLEKKGSARKFVNYLEQIDLRTGVFYKNLAQTNNFESVNEIGVSFGVSLPIVRFRSKIDLAGFVSKRGDLGIHSLEETIVGLKFSISANELWFVNLED